MNSRLTNTQILDYQSQNSAFEEPKTRFDLVKENQALKDENAALNRELDVASKTLISMTRRQYAAFRRSTMLLAIGIFLCYGALVVGLLMWIRPLPK